MFLSSGCVLITYSAECNGPKFHKTLMFLGQAGMFLSFQARRSSATRSSTSDLTVSRLPLIKHEAALLDNQHLSPSEQLLSTVGNFDEISSFQAILLAAVCSISMPCLSIGHFHSRKKSN